MFYIIDTGYYWHLGRIWERVHINRFNS